MGLIDNEVQQLETNLIEMSKASENPAEEVQCKPVTVNNNKINCGDEEREGTGAHNIENKPVSIEERSEISKEKGVCHEESYKDLGAERARLVNAKILQYFESLDVSSSLNKLTHLRNLSTLPGIASGGQRDAPQLTVTNDSGQLRCRNRESYGQSQKTRAMSIGSVTRSLLLRTKSKEKPEEAEPNATVNEAITSGEKKRGGRKKKKQQLQRKNTSNEFSKTKTHLRYLLHRIKYEQNFIDAYSAEGWKGQSADKLKPKKELQRAESHILRYKIKIRELFQCLDQSLAVGKLPEFLFDSKGEIDSEDIFCAKCGSKDLALDNDIILCDGACQRGYHQTCLEPPLLKEDIPSGDEDWFCPGCDCKVNCINMLKDFQGSKIMITDSWEKIFPEAAEDTSGLKLADGSGFISDDSEDDDYDPDKHTMVDKVDGDESGPDECNYSSAPDHLASLNNEKNLGLHSDDSEDDDFDPSAPDHDEDETVKQDISSSDFTSDSEDLGALLEDGGGHGEDIGEILSPPDLGQPTKGSKEETSLVGQPINDELLYLMKTSVEPVSSKRRVERLDYKRLNDETFGNSSSGSSDEDFVDSTSRKRRRTDRETTQVKDKTPLIDSININGENQEKRELLPRRLRRKDADQDPGGSSTKVASSSGSKRAAPKRIGQAAVERLYVSFDENRYPVKPVKEDLARELGLTVTQVSKWFAHARWSFNHKPQMKPNSTELVPQQTTLSSNRFSNQDMGNEKPNPTSLWAVEDDLATTTNEEHSGKEVTENGDSMIDQAPINETTT